MDEKMERLDESQFDRAVHPDYPSGYGSDFAAGGADYAGPPSEDPRLVGRMKNLYSMVIEKRPEFELSNSVTGPPESVDLFIKAYESAGQQGMSNVHEIIRKMEELSRGNY